MAKGELDHGSLAHTKEKSMSKLVNLSCMKRRSKEMIVTGTWPDFKALNSFKVGIRADNNGGKCW